jgi:hypothetical protein
MLKLSVAFTLFFATGKRVEAKREQTALSSLPVCAGISASYDRTKPYAAIGWGLRRVRCHAPALNLWHAAHARFCNGADYELWWRIVQAKTG